MAYRIPKDDGSYLKGVTVKDGIVYGPDGKRLGPTRMFPRMEQDTGSFFDGAKGGKYDTESKEELVTPETPAPGGAADAKGTRVSPTGITQKGMSLGGVNALFNSLSSPDRQGGAKMTAGELPAASNFFSEALPTTAAGAQQGHEAPRVNYSWDSQPEEGTWDDEKGAIIPHSVPGSLGGKPENVEDGTSAKPDIADAVRAIRMSPERMAARSAFLDPNNKGYGAIRARDRAVGAFDQKGVGGMRIDQEFVQFKPGMSADARFELSGGKIQSKEDAEAFLTKYTNRMAKPDSPKK